MPGSTEFDRVITVPFAPETPASGIGTSSDRAWYRRSVAVHRPARRAPAPPPVRRGRSARPSVRRRQRAWRSTKAVTPRSRSTSPTTSTMKPSNSSSVRRTITRISLHLAGKQEWLAEPHGIWYPRTTGIWRSVYLEETGSTRIDDLDWQGSAQAMTVTLRARVAGPRRWAAIAARASRRPGRLVAGACRLHSPRPNVAMHDGNRRREASMTAAHSCGHHDGPCSSTPTSRSSTVGGGVVDEVRSYTALRDRDASTTAISA